MAKTIAQHELHHRFREDRDKAFEQGITQ